MLSPAQRKQLDAIEIEWIEIAMARMEFTFNDSAWGVTEWNRLWERGIELQKDREKLLREVINVPVAQDAAQIQAYMHLRTE
jgi:hypothetical protein